MSDVELLALHGLAVKKAGSAAAVADILGLPEGDVASALDGAAGAGRAMAAKGMFMVTPAGRAWLDERYPEAYAGLREDPEATAAYERFERVNRELLRLFTDWQMMPAGGERVPNDHSDADYDRDVIDRLGALHERGLKPLERFQALDGRLGEYIRRLESAYDRVLAGEHEYVSGARVDSYHTVWFELHEDLLRMLGREREEQV
ncbi:MAG: hypothetical protein AVDCRST_MAG13-1257 [uncultured Solirubrobacteraceae bacterium]|uniref:Uncharacterized protein n=1 Tax=uncultured Solirubrobacteraceae bacterium TaxID=1162706 RepID=A0A6J4RUS1_9ACTN|nr:MAG: hypothetical protein AVDCRST_MAG13-1257 [uncultured Solirubrobacteraceae bacterium]